MYMLICRVTIKRIVKDYITTTTKKEKITETFHTLKKVGKQKQRNKTDKPTHTKIIIWCTLSNLRVIAVIKSHVMCKWNMYTCIYVCRCIYIYMSDR